MTLSVQELTKSFGGLTAVDNCSFDVRDESVTALVGGNGAGKTTVFNLISGTLDPDRGRVELDGHDIIGLPPAKRSALGIGRTFQDVRLFPDMSVLDNVAVAVPSQPGESLGRVFWTPRATFRAQKKAREQAREALREVGFDRDTTQLAGSLSFAEQKVVAIARLLASRASHLLFDEPASGLDERSIDRLCELIRSLSGRGRTIVLVEHNTMVVRRLADWIVFLNAGRTVSEGVPDEVLSSEAYRMTYLGTGSKP